MIMMAALRCHCSIPQLQGLMARKLGRRIMLAALPLSLRPSSSAWQHSPASGIEGRKIWVHDHAGCAALVLAALQLCVALSGSGSRG